MGERLQGQNRASGEQGGGPTPREEEGSKEGVAVGGAVAHSV